MADVSLDDLIQHIFGTLTGELLSVSDDFTPTSDLVDAGLDSLALTQLLLSIEEHTGVWVDEGSLTPENLANTEELARCVYEQIESP